MNSGILIIHKDENAIIINKPAGIPSQSDPTGDMDAMSLTSDALAALGEKPDLWFVHRLDRTVGGLLVFARNKKSAAELSRLIRENKFEKKYFAVCHGMPSDGEYRDFLFKDSATGQAYVVKTARSGAKSAVLYAKNLATENGMSLVSVTLETGRFHQIRAQFASRKNPLVGDKKYGSRDTSRRTPCLFSYEISFELFGKQITASALAPLDEYPWNLFDKKLYGMPT